MAMVSAKLFSVRLTTASSLAAATVPMARTATAAAAATRDLRAMVSTGEVGNRTSQTWGTGVQGTGEYEADGSGGVRKTAVAHDGSVRDAGRS